MGERTVDEELPPKTLEQTVEAEAPVNTKRDKVVRKSKQAREYNAVNCMDFVKNTLSRGVEAIIAEFRDEKRCNDFTKMKVFVENNKEGRNRYKDVGCLDETRVKLTIGPVNYIHANYVAGHNNSKRFICTQAPLDKTIPDFWYMIVQEKSQVIVMLCNHKEMGVKKCSDYFPTSITNALIVNDDITVTAVKIEPLTHIKPLYVPGKTATKPTVIMKTELAVFIRSLNKEHQVHHFHWKDWPDRGVPSIDYASIYLCKRFNKGSKRPITIHCSAGIGRTGSIVLINLMYELHMAGIAWESTLVKYLRDLRVQRNNSVQTEQQYLFVHAVMVSYVFGHLGLGLAMRKFCKEMKNKSKEEKTKEEKKKEAAYLDLLMKFDSFSSKYEEYCSGFA